MQASRYLPMVLGLALLSGQTVLAQNETLLHSFNSNSTVDNTNSPDSQLVQGSDGALYGLASSGGPAYDGGVYRVTTSGAETTLDTFSNSGFYGINQTGGRPMVLAPDGNLYGTFVSGAGYGGAVFKMSNSGVINILHSFGDHTVQNDASSPNGVIRATDGNFYGTSYYGGSANQGTVFKVSTSGTVTILHSFGDGTIAQDGSYPLANLVQGTDGNFYGTTTYGGTSLSSNYFGYGTIFKMTPSGAMTILHNFSDGSLVNDGAQPKASLIQGADGNFYGTTYSNGANGSSNAGTIFRVTPAGTVTILHLFGVGSGLYADGGSMQSNLIRASDGNFYGAANTGGQTYGGFIFKMTASGAYTIVNQFGLTTNSSYYPTGLIQGTDGNLYGTCTNGGLYYGGAVWKLPFPAAPSSSAPTITSGSTATIAVGSAFSYQITATHSPTSYNATGIPAGLTVDTTTGLISGTPTQAGIFIVTLTATNAFGQGVPSVLTLQVGSTLPIITSPLTVAGTVGTYIFYTITASNTPLSFDATGFPAGMEVDKTSGYLTGAPTVGGKFNVTLKAANAAGTGTATLVMTIATPVPTITSDTIVTGTVGIPFSYQIAATTNPTSFDAPGLPGGLTVNKTTGAITGTPTTAGNYTVTVKATNGIGTGSQAITIKISVPTPVITTSDTATGAVGGAFNYQIFATNSPTGFTASGLPPGVTINQTTGLISGTPTAAGIYSATLKGINATGTGAGFTLTITITNGVPAIISSSTSTVAVGTTFLYTILGTNNPTSFTASTLPVGLAFNTTTGQISGTPTTVGTTSVTLKAKNAIGTSAAFTLTITVVLAPPVIISANTSTGTVGELFHYFTIATNGPTSFTATALPAGLTFDQASGAITGTPTAAGTTVVKLTAKNASGTSATFSLTLTVKPSPPTINSAETASGTQGVAFSYATTATYGPTSFASDALPDGLTLNLTTGKITGTPTVSGVFPVNLTAKNAAGTGPSFRLTITIIGVAPLITSSGTASGIKGTAFTYQIVATNSATSYTATGLPAGLSLNATTGKITGTPTAVGVTTANLTAKNLTGTSAVFHLVITIAGPPVITSAKTGSSLIATAFSYLIIATNDATSFTATGLPAGLSVNKTTGQISGTPTVAGVFKASLTATNTAGTSSVFTLTLTITSSVPVITGPATASGAIETGFSALIIATNNPTSYAASGLPAGLTLDGTSGQISGTPTKAGSYTVTLHATNASGTSKAFTLKLTITALAPVIIGSATAEGVVAETFNYFIIAINNPTSYSATGLPAGLSLDTASGQITGKPTAVGITVVTLKAKNSTGTSSAFKLTITIVGPAPVITSALTASGTVGLVFSYQIVATNGPTVYAAYGLPPGLLLNAATGKISGTPTLANLYTASITASNPDGTSDLLLLKITISPNTSYISSPPFASPILGVPFSYQITVSGTKFVATKYNATSLPAGLAINKTTGLISGTPTTVGIYDVTLTATNAAATTLTGQVHLIIVKSTETVLHSFYATTSGIRPAYNLIQATDGNFYGVTTSGGKANQGTVFKATPTGVLTFLHHFGDGTTAHDGNLPLGSLVQDTDGNLYGTTANGGVNNGGIVFRITTTGVFTIIHSFTDGTVTHDGANPSAGLIKDSTGKLYGTTLYGGSAARGTIYRITTAGAVTILHHFQDGTVVSDGSNPQAPLLLGKDGSYYGTTSNGGSTGTTTASTGNGTVFKLTTTGVLTVLHNFGDGTIAHDGTHPNAPVIQGADGKLYGTTLQGGAANLGAAFTLTTTGSFALRHSFGDGTVAHDGTTVYTPLVQGADGLLYGTTFTGGSASAGTIFRLTLTGTETILHQSGDGSVVNDGFHYDAGLVQGTDGNFYGTGYTGGAFDSRGAFFRMTPAGVVTLLASFGGPDVTSDGSLPVGQIQGTDGNFYGTTFSGGAANNGSVFKITPKGVVTILHSFRDGTTPNDGSQPYAGLIQGADGSFYGTTSTGGSTVSFGNPSGNGIAFKITSSGVYTVLHQFGDGSVAHDGTTPQSGFFQGTDGTLYGVATAGGSAGKGSAYKMTLTGVVTVLHSFGDGSTAHDGVGPTSALILGSDGLLYGTTQTGGASNFGTVFKMTTAGKVTVLHSFSDGSVAQDGATPFSGVVLAKDGFFYGTTTDGGINDGGVAFKMTAAGVVTIVHRFGDGSMARDGIDPNGQIFQGKDGFFYGTCREGGDAGDITGGGGILYRLSQDGSETIFHYFSDGSVASDGHDPFAGLTVGLDGNFYGTTLYGGTADLGTFFKVTLISPQVISFPAIADMLYPSADFALNAVATSGLAVTFTTTGPVTISGNVATLTGTGTVSIRAHQDGNASFDPAPSVLNTFTVTAAP